MKKPKNQTTLKFLYLRESLPPLNIPIPTPAPAPPLLGDTREQLFREKDLREGAFLKSQLYQPCLKTSFHATLLKIAHTNDTDVNRSFYIHIYMYIYLYIYIYILTSACACGASSVRRLSNIEETAGARKMSEQLDSIIA